MINVDKAMVLMSRMVELLRLGGENQWAAMLEDSCQQIPYDPSAVSAKIISAYGGAGSLNDIVLYKNGNVLVSESTELDDLRSQLYRMCRE